MPKVKRFNIDGLQFEYSEATTDSIYHYHNSYEIYLIHSGENMCFIKDRAYRLKPNDITFIEKNTIHKTNYLTELYSRSFFNVDDSFLDNSTLESLKRLCAERVYTPENPQYIKKLIDKIKTELESPDSISSDLIKCYLTEFIAYCARNKSMYVENEVQNPIIERLVKHINDNYNENITLAGSAKYMNMSESYLSRLFKNITGFTFKEYLCTVRIKHAKKLLTTTQKNVKQIASECGFNDSNYFSKTFKDESGISPLKYRRLFENE